MQQRRDELAILLAYLFSEDIREHPMAPNPRRRLLQTVRQLLYPDGKEDTHNGQE